MKAGGLNKLSKELHKKFRACTKSGEDELLNRLRMFKAWICTPGRKEWTDDNEQAYREIAEIIGDYFRLLKEIVLTPQVMVKRKR